MHLRHLRSLAAIVLFATFSSQLFAADRYSIILEKQEEKAKGRWSLADWLDTRDRMRMMDLWLALHSPSPYEFYLGADYNQGTTASGTPNSGWNLYFAAYATIFGLEIQRQESTLQKGFTGLGHIRIFGLYNQATNLTLSGGVQTLDRSGVSFLCPVVQISSTIYVAKPAGLEFSFRHLLKTVRSNRSFFYNRWTAGAFIDFKFLRVYAGYTWQLEGGDVQESPSGYHFGARFYF